MTSSLSNIVNNLSEGIHRSECKLGQNDKENVKHVQLNISIVTDFFDIQIIKMI